MEKSEPHSIVFYDGECGFCNATVQTIWERDENAIFHFSSLQSDFAQKFLKQHAVERINMDTMYVYHNEKVFSRSRAVAEIGKHLRGKRFRICAWLIRAFPYPTLLDPLYNFIARNRHRLSQKAQCKIPPSEVKKRFLD